MSTILRNHFRYFVIPFYLQTSSIPTKPTYKVPFVQFRVQFGRRKKLVLTLKLPRHESGSALGCFGQCFFIHSYVLVTLVLHGLRSLINDKYFAKLNLSQCSSNFIDALQPANLRTDYTIRSYYVINRTKLNHSCGVGFLLEKTTIKN